ncbi:MULTISPECIES: hypothetical protein [Actinomycetes]|uniref:Transposase n=1 Tax=Streptoalloteichus tenebrarius (strain ATCC 17920 / DSM 40477 / JCM 4838 / CBS 697.72 / NBRC 16177 / NCIMB 11028 / NRRL B-12390 / A12253. 1 / ISP 5477) TaxID=1933 RepID=A0ABT1I1A2_STRSD|nr:hypothetical protein [Streptoalloteichus tenebrarius]MCP2261568.1 hypothetical protein [Streptoalloteichus tenebrarius]BFF02657.1 hypothetical protein GCM10020241_43320 [Streptoalloteichus tenebrarius]GHE87183.1 hypothetical protein GCM10018782_65740 [Streptomyces griseoaurantiacus]
MVLTVLEVLLGGIRVSRPGPGHPFNVQRSSQRTVVECRGDRLARFGGLTTRHAQRDTDYQAELAVTAIVRWLG